jgi:hypothetical protein
MWVNISGSNYFGLSQPPEHLNSATVSIMRGVRETEFLYGGTLRMF